MICFVSYGANIYFSKHKFISFEEKKEKRKKKGRGRGKKANLIWPKHPQGRKYRQGKIKS